MPLAAAVEAALMDSKQGALVLRLRLRRKRDLQYTSTLSRRWAEEEVEGRPLRHRPVASLLLQLSMDRQESRRRLSLRLSVRRR
jgi:hypothetical protein